VWHRSASAKFDGCLANRRCVQRDFAFLQPQEFLHRSDEFNTAVGVGSVASDRSNHDRLQLFPDGKRRSECDQQLVSKGPPFWHRRNGRGLRSRHITAADAAAIDPEDAVNQPQFRAHSTGSAQFAGGRLLAIVNR
jgi:hypothetical protein